MLFSHKSWQLQTFAAGDLASQFQDSRHKVEILEQGKSD